LVITLTIVATINFPLYMKQSTILNMNAKYISRDLYTFTIEIIR